MAQDHLAKKGKCQRNLRGLTDLKRAWARFKRVCDMMPTASYDNSVFINAPFDESREKLFMAMVFAVIACGRTPRCALEIEDSGEPRIRKIVGLIGQCGWGLHDLSFMELDEHSGLPRFNMPFEFGLFLGAKEFGCEEQKMKHCLVLDSQNYRYQKALSDIAGQDVGCHKGTEKGVVYAIGGWLRSVSPSSEAIYAQYCTFKTALPVLCKEIRQTDLGEYFNYSEYVFIVRRWLDFLQKAKEDR